MQVAKVQLASKSAVETIMQQLGLDLWQKLQCKNSRVNVALVIKKQAQTLI